MASSEEQETDDINRELREGSAVGELYEDWMDVNESGDEDDETTRQHNTGGNATNFYRNDRYLTFPKPTIQEADSVYEDANSSSFFQFIDFGGDWTKNVRFLIVTVIVLLLGMYLYSPEAAAKLKTMYNNNINGQTKTNVELYEDAVNKIKREFPSQPHKFWFSIDTLIKHMLKSKPTKPAIFLLLHNSDKSAECLAWKIGNAASLILDTPGIIEVLAENVQQYTDNELIANYREQLEKKGVMIVYRLDRIPGNVARSFHSFCDTYNPLVRRSVLLFTLADSSDDRENKKPLKRAGETMKRLWRNHLVNSTLDPLITRLTDNVLEVNSEETVSCISQ